MPLSSSCWKASCLIDARSSTVKTSRRRPRYSLRPHQPGREVSGLVGVEHGVVDVAQRVDVHEAGAHQRVALVRIDVDGPGEEATYGDDPVTVVDDFAVLVDDVVASVVSDDEASPDPGPHRSQAFCRSCASK